MSCCSQRSTEALRPGKILLREGRLQIIFALATWAATAAALGFLLTSQPASADWQPSDGHKMHFPQLPDEEGWDVNATKPMILADDWRCSQTGLVTDIHFWGSWRDMDGDGNGDVGTIDHFVISIHDDIPANPPTIPYSRPGATLHEWRLQPAVVPHDPPTLEAWYDPATGLIVPNDHGAYFQYNIKNLDTIVPDPFVQIQGRIYWLNISAVLLDLPGTKEWGWKSSRDHFNDDAVWATWTSLNWIDIYEPPRYNEFNGSMNLAGQFVGGGTNYYGQGWYFYENTNWWNIWFYDNPFTTQHLKQSNIGFRVLPLIPGQPSVVSVTINWSTPAWSLEGNPPGEPRRPPVPPLTAADEALYVGRQLPPLWQWPGGVLPPTGELVALPHTISYNPEWVSIDVSGSNFVIQKGTISHECVRTSLDLAFVITGPEPCPLPTVNPWCTTLQPRDCASTNPLNEVCLPRQASFDATGNPIIELCDCFSTTAGCGPVDIQPNATIGYTVSCPGPCPTPEVCELHFSGVPQGKSSIDSSQIPFGAAVTCACVVPQPILCPLPAIAECAALQARDCETIDPTNQKCLPKVIRRNTGQVFFPPTEGIDILTQTTGYVTIKEPSGATTSHPIRESPNTTRVIRESPVADPDGHRTLATEMIEMDLMAGGGGGGAAIMIRESPTRASSGGVVGRISANTDYPADSFFDLFVEIDIPDLGVYGLYNDQPIRLEANDIVAMPPLGSSFKSPMVWQPVELLEAGGNPTGYWIIEVRHDPPPPPPTEWEVVLCDCIDPTVCHVTQEFSVIPTCTGGCPVNEVCTQIITYGPGTVDYSCECVQAPLEACCFVDGRCEMRTAADCLLVDGTPKGPGTLCLTDLSGNGIDDACEILDKVVCEPQGGINPFHPSTYWYDVTPSGFGRCDFHVRVYDPNPGDYTNWSMNPYPWPAGSWAFLVHQVGTEWWASWWDTDPGCSHAFFVKTRFQFDNPNASTWGDWTTTISNTSDPYNQIVDRSANHPAETDGNGYRVHVPTPPAPTTQACCLPNGTCKDVLYDRCLALGGDPQGPGTTCMNPSVVCNPLKWAQPPTYSAAVPGAQCFWGWDDPSSYYSGPIVADDWACSSNQPITDIHWWGSYPNWTTPTPPPQGLGPDLFHIGIWTDVPANQPNAETCCHCWSSTGTPPPTCSPNPPDPETCRLWGFPLYDHCDYYASSQCMQDHCQTIPPLTYSHPGKMVHQWIVPRMELNERYVGCDEYPGMPSDTCFRYDFNITDSNEWFYQQPSADPTVYWISISAMYLMPPMQYPWGWKTREHFFNDDAVRIFDPVAPGVGASFVDGLPIETPDGKSWDMAFVLTTKRQAGVKWEQWPNPGLPGLHAHDGITLADNWECAGGKVTDLHWWGNYELDLLGQERRGAGIQCINLSIHKNQPGAPWCLPQEPAEWGVCALFSALHERDTGLRNSEGSKIYVYDFYLSDAFAQLQGDIYWLDVEAQSTNPQDPALWRWQENDRISVPRLCPAAQRSMPPPPFMWSSIQWPAMPPDPVRYSEMAFRVTSLYPPGPDPTGIKKSRFISLAAGNAGEQTALRVKLTSLHHVVPPYPLGPPTPFTLFEGQSMWVGPPVSYFESGTTGTTFMASKLQCDPYYQDWSTISLLHITGEAITPSSSYDIESLDVSCMGNEATCTDVSAPLTIVTARSGDVIINEIANFADISALVAKFQAKPGAPIKARAKMIAGDARGLISIAPNVGFGDIAVDVDAFKGKPYAYKPGKCTGNVTKACIADADCVAQGTTGPCILCP